MSISVDFNSLRRDRVIESLEKVEDSSERERLLLDKLFQLQDTLFEVQASYCELLISYNKLCALDL